MRSAPALLLLSLATTLRLFGADCSIKPIACGGTVTGSIGSSSCLIVGFPTARYSFTGAAGQQVHVVATSSTSNTIGIELATADGQTITSGFDTPVSMDATLPSAGQYVISLNFGNPGQSGPFSITLTCQNGSTPPPTTCSYSGTLSTTTPITDHLGPEDGTVCLGASSYGVKYQFAATKDVPVRITLASSDFHPYLDVEARDGSNGSFRSASSNGTIAVDFIPDTTDTYRVFVGSSDSTPMSGNYTLRLDPLNIEPCRRRAAAH